MNKHLIGSFEAPILEDDLQVLMHGLINEDYIRNETGTEELTKIVHLSLTIDTSRQSIYDLHILLPNLIHLVLDNSLVASVRDLGIGLRFLKSLSLSCCGLIDIDGIGVLTGLQDLCLSDNSIVDVTPLAMHENLQNLNLSGNRVADISAADSLSSCLALRSLFLSRNPLCKARNYRLIIASIIGTLTMLDGKPVDPEASKKVNNGMILESAAELRILEEDLDDELRLEQDILCSEPTPTTESKSNGKNNTTFRAVAAAKYTEVIPDTGSELTHGSSVVLAGNMAAAVRRRRNASESSRANSSRGSEMTDQGEYESTLDILDAAVLGEGCNSEPNMVLCRPNSNRERSAGTLHSHSGSFLKEGDVTTALMGTSAMYPDKALSKAIAVVDEDDLYITGAISPQTSSRSRNRPRQDSAELPLKEVVSPNTSRSRRIDSRDPSNMSMSFDLDTSFAAASNLLRPRTTAGGLGSFRQSASSGALSPSIPAMGAAAASPRQRNSSRPQSAASAGRNSSSPIGDQRNTAAHAAPFKVVLDRRQSSGTSEEGTNSPVGVPFSSLKATSKSSSIVHLDIVKRSTGGFMVNGDDPYAQSTFAGIADDDSDTEDIAITHAARHRLMNNSSTAGSANSVTSNLKARQQMLQRLKSTSAKDSMMEQRLTDYKMVDRIGSPPTAKRFLPVETSLFAPPLEIGIAEQGLGRSDNSKNNRADECELESLENSPQRPPSSSGRILCCENQSKDTMSAKAGMSLGFHLASSLAAIDKWVHDMNSDEEEDEEEEEGGGERRLGDRDAGEEDDASEEGVQVFHHNSRGAAECFAVRGEETHPAGGARSVGLEGASKDSCTSDFSGSGASRGSNSTVARNKILSRDAILTMCSKSGRDTNQSEHAQDDEYSDLEEPDLELPVQIRQSQLKTSTSTTSTATTTGKRLDNGCANASTASTRVRNADIFNRVNGRSSYRRPKPVPDFPAASQQTHSGGIRNDAQYDSDTLMDGNTASPPRYDSTDSSKTASVIYGQAVSMPDSDLVELLKQRPKNTAVLRTPSSFQDYFRGMSARRMRGLLERAYADVEDRARRKEKVEKRLELLTNVLTQ